MEGSCVEDGVVIIRDAPRHLGLGHIFLEPIELFAAGQIHGLAAAGFAIFRAIEREELRKICVLEGVPAGGAVAGVEEIIEVGREVALVFGIVAIVVAGRGIEGDFANQTLIGLEKLIFPIVIHVT